MNAKKSAPVETSAKQPATRKSAASGAKPVTAKKAAPAARKPAPAAKAAPATKKPAPAAKKPAPAKAAPAAKKGSKPATSPTPVKPSSPFVKGDKVVYPHHGAATIIAVEKRDFDGKKADFFVLQVEIDSLILRVPAARAVDLGVRPVISKTAARKVLAVFKTEPEEAGANWSRWYKLLTEKINSGDIYQVAEVVRDLTFAQQTKGISPALKRMLSKARLILTSELRFALELSEEEAMKRLDRSLPKVDGEEAE